MLLEREEDLRKTLAQEWTTRLQRSEEDSSKLIGSLSFSLDSSEARGQDLKRELE